MRNNFPLQPIAIAVILLAATLTLHAQTSTGPASTGSVHGTVVDANDAVIPYATVNLTPANAASALTQTTDQSGAYNFSAVPAGSFHLTVTATGFATQTLSGTVQAGEIRLLEPISLAVSNATTTVTVHSTQHELAEQQLHLDEQQRVLGIVPNFYVEYNHNAVALAPGEKFRLATRYSFDPINLLSVAALAGVEQYSNTYSGFGQGTIGYAKYFGAGLASYTTDSYISNAILPTLLHQDPRYYVRGTGTIKHRVLYTLANLVICKGDNRKWQPNYSGLIGGLASAGISNLYYPAANRNGAALTFENFGFGLLGGEGGNIFQEFFSRRLSTGIPKN